MPRVLYEYKKCSLLRYSGSLQTLSSSPAKRSAEEADKRVHDNAAEIVFFMNPTKVQEVKDVATAGERMPQKATYFYPKLLTGLVMQRIE